MNVALGAEEAELFLEGVKRETSSGMRGIMRRQLEREIITPRVFHACEKV
jgi:hypothetical protein